MDLGNQLLHWKDTPSVLGIYLLFAVVGSKMVRWSPRLRRWGVGIGVAGAFLYAAFGFEEFQPGTEGDLFSLALRSLIAGLVVSAAAWVLLGSVGYVIHHGIVVPAEAVATQARVEAEREQIRQIERELEDAKRRQAEEEAAKAARLEAAEAERIRNLPTVQQRMLAARKKRDDFIRELEQAGLDDTIMTAAREQAQQDYLREIDELRK